MSSMVVSGTWLRLVEDVLVDKGLNASQARQVVERLRDTLEPVEVTLRDQKRLVFDPRDWLSMPPIPGAKR